MTIFQAMPHVPSVCPISQGDAHPFDSSVLLPGPAATLQEHLLGEADPPQPLQQDKEMSLAPATTNSWNLGTKCSWGQLPPYCDNNCAL